ncbi:MAG: class II aldolase/adducin family protein [Sedimentisphaerales bacterium]|nr:class II aldolase/adducin family protein [Sedimentisphaerales bacterium]
MTMFDTQSLRQEIITACLYLRDKLGYFIGTWGNISVRLDEGLLLTPTRMEYDQLKPEDLVVISLEGEIIKGERLPTSEMELHRQMMLKRPDLRAIIHSHSPYASVAAAAHGSVPVIMDDMAEVIGGEVHCAKYVPACRHQELAQAACDAIGPDACAVLLANHGVLTGGRDLKEALVAAQFMEKAAMIFIQAQVLGGAHKIPENHWRQERHRYLYKYGTAEDMRDDPD